MQKKAGTLSLTVAILGAVAVAVPPLLAGEYFYAVSEDASGFLHVILIILSFALLYVAGVLPGVVASAILKRIPSRQELVVIGFLNGWLLVCVSERTEYFLRLLRTPLLEFFWGALVLSLLFIVLFGYAAWLGARFWVKRVASKSTGHD